jgi:hypothetical protein
MKLTLKIVTLASLSIGCLVTSVDTAKAASVINFDDLAPSLFNYAPIPGDYGSNLLSTPDIAVEYRTLTTSGTTIANNLSFWNNGYSGLTNVAFPTQNSHLGEISFIPRAGYSVTLNSFDLSGYFADQPDQTVRIMDEFYNILQDYPFFNVEGNSGPSSFNPNLTRAGILRLQFGPSWNTGIDNIRFDQSLTTSIPTPALLPGLIGMGAAAYRKRKGAATAKT